TTVFDAGITFTATVASTGTQATGTVVFKDGAVSIGQAALNASGVATFSTASLSVTGSPHTISAVYGGNSSFSGSTSNSLTQKVTRATTTVSLTSPVLATVSVGTTLSFTATVSSSGTLATGTVTFED